MDASIKAIAFFLCSIGLVGALGVASAGSGFQQGLGPNDHMKLNCDEEPCDAVARGRVAFNRRNLKDLGGNGRACADCHMPSDSFQLSPAGARARFERLLAARAHNAHADDPLFRPVDADDFRVNGDKASDFSNLVENGLVRVTMPLPANVRLIDPTDPDRCQPTDETSVDLWRAVMPVLNVAITGPDHVAPIWPPGAPRVPIMGQDPNGPNRQGGYQHDARFGTLQEQARGALFAHAQVSMEPPARLLDDLAAFQQTLFSSQASKRLAEAILSGDGAVPRPGPRVGRARAAGQGSLHPRVRPMPRRYAAPEHHRPGRDPSVRPLVRYHPNLRPARGRRPTVSRRVRSGSRATRARTASRAPTAPSNSSRPRTRDDCCSRANRPTSGSWT